MSAIVRLDGVSKSFGALKVIDGLSMSLAPGEALGVIGPNGAGKSTMFNLISGGLAPDAGRILFGDRDVTRLAPHARCRLGIGRSYQIPQPFGGMTVFENVVVAAAFGGGRSEHDVYADCADVLARCGLADKANRAAGTLTLLDRKRLELARALATRPQVLLLDEVAGGLTEHECVDLVALIKDVRAMGISIVWIEHVVHALLAVIDRLLVLHGGAFIAEGDPHTVIRSPQVQDIYMGIPAEA